MAAGEDVPDRDLILSFISGVGHEYDSVVVLISSQHQTMSLEDAQFLFLMQEQIKEHMNTSTQLNVAGAASHFALNQCGNNDRRDKRNGGNSSNTIYEVLKAEMALEKALQCSKSFDQGFQGPTPNNQANFAQENIQSNIADLGNNQQQIYIRRPRRLAIRSICRTTSIAHKNRICI
ncbi:hypothetical protein ACOSP7_017320 [Xanthoceras sorbifolium]